MALRLEEFKTVKRITSINTKNQKPKTKNQKQPYLYSTVGSGHSMKRSAAGGPQMPAG
jgi:hypothetical protein